MNVIAKIHDEKTYNVSDVRVQCEFWLTKSEFDKLDKYVQAFKGEGVTADVVVCAFVRKRLELMNL